MACTAVGTLCGGGGGGVMIMATDGQGPGGRYWWPMFACLLSLSTLSHCYRLGRTAMGHLVHLRPLPPPPVPHDGPPVNVGHVRRPAGQPLAAP